MTNSMMEVLLKSVGATVFSLSLMSVFVSVSGDARADTVRMRDGEIYEDVEIEKATWEAVVFKRKLGRRSVPQRVDGEDVQALERPSPRLSRLRAAIESADYRGGLKVLDEMKYGAEEWEQTEGLFLSGRLYSAWAEEDPEKVKDAIDAYGGYLKKSRSTKDFYVPHATYELGEAYLRAQQPKSAEKEFSTLGTFGRRNSYWGVKSVIGKAQAIVAAAKGDDRRLLEARTLLNDVDRTRFEGLRREATVVRAEILNSQGQYSQAERLLQKEIVNGKRVYDEYYVRACHLMGDSYRGRNDTENLQRAELWYLRATLFGKAYRSVYRETCRSLIELYEALGMPDRAREWKGRLTQAGGENDGQVGKSRREPNKNKA